MDEKGLLNVGEWIISTDLSILALQAMSIFTLELDARIGHIPLHILPFI